MGRPSLAQARKMDFHAGFVAMACPANQIWHLLRMDITALRSDDETTVCGHLASEHLASEHLDSAQRPGPTTLWPFQCNRHENRKLLAGPIRPDSAQRPTAKNTPSPLAAFSSAHRAVRQTVPKMLRIDH